MRLMDLLRDDLVQAPLAARTRDEACAELVDALIAAGELPAKTRREVLDAIATRERSQPTGLGSGVAVPHGLVDVAPDIIAAMGIAPPGEGGGIDFSAVDGQPARIIFLMIVPHNRLQAHVRTLAGVARLLNDHGFRDRLLAARSPSAIMEVIVAQENLHPARSPE